MSAPAARRGLPGSLVAATRAGHAALGLGVAAFLYFVVLTGSLLMFAPQLDHAQQLAAPKVEQVTPALAQQAVHNLPGELDSWRRITMQYPRAGLPQLVLVAQPYGSGKPQRFAADADGVLTPLPAAWTDFLKSLHVHLMLPGESGEIVVGLLGIFLLALVLGGLLSYPRMFRDAFVFRAGAHDGIRQADIHHRLGVWGLPFHVTLAFTGAVMALALPVAAVVGQFGYDAGPAKVGKALLGPSPGRDRTPASAPDLEKALAQVDGGNPQAIQRVVLLAPAWRSRLVRVDLAKPQRLAYGDRIYFDADQRNVTPGGLLDQRAGLSAYSALIGLHFGNYGGVLLQILYGLLGLGLCTIVASGLRQWLARKRARGQPWPRTERLWAAWVWGGALAMGVSWLGALLSDRLAGTAASVFGIILVLSLLLALVVRNSARLRQGLRVAVAACVAVSLVLVWAASMG